jgi:hypothetical protein
VKEVVVLVSNDVVLLTRDDHSADGALVGRPTFRREVGSISGRWDFWVVGLFGHDGKVVGFVCPAPPQNYFSFVSKWL